MSVWKRFQRVGKKAGKFQFTASYTELVIETHHFDPSNVVITWLRRNRKYPSESIKLSEVKSKASCYKHVWEVPRNEEIVTTLYKMKKELEYEKKDWTFQIEDVGDHGTRRRLLGYHNLNMAQYADILPTQNNIKVSFKLSSKKIKSATLFLTLSGVFIKEGDATDDDMISVASLMSLPSNQNFSSLQNSDIARLSDFDDMSIEPTHSINEKFTELFDKIENLDRQTWNIDEIANGDSSITGLNDKNVPRSSDSRPLSDGHYSKTFISSTPVVLGNNKSNDSSGDDDKGDRLSNIAEEDRSPCQESNSTSDLLDWCKFITCGYKNVSITNFTTSFRNGIAFCAIIHHFHPELIDFNSLKPSNVKENNRIAFTSAAKLGIPKVLDPNEMNFLKVPDALSIMTYLHQLRTHFTDSNLVITPASISNNSQHNYSKQISSNFTTMISPMESKEFDKSNNYYLSEVHNQITSTAAPFDEVDGLTIYSLPSRVLSEIEEPYSRITQNKEDKSDMNVEGKTKSSKKSKPKLSSLNVDGTLKEDSSWSEKKIKRVNPGKLNLFTSHESNDPLTKHGNSPTKKSSVSSPSSIKKVSVVIEKDSTENSYICAETAALEREQEKIDEEASQMEKRLRLVMNKDKQKESELLKKWFVLVNKKNALIRRNMQLQILDKEQNLEKKWALLQEELRQIISVEDWNKTEDMKKREDLLMKDLICIINQRDKVVCDLDNYEQSICNDIDFMKQQPQLSPSNKLARTLIATRLSDKNCVVQ